MSKIEWTERTWNPVRGCSRVSAGCDHCYAEGIATRFSGPGQPFAGFAKRVHGAPHWTSRVELVAERLLEPLRWRKPAVVFVNSMSDLFHEGLPDEAIDRVFAVMALAPQHTFQVLTKRAERMRAWRNSDAIITHNGVTLGPRNSEHLWPNVWLGVSVEDHAAADARIPHLLSTPAALRFVSYEPALGAVDWGRWIAQKPYYTARCEHCGHIGSTKMWLEDRNYDDSQPVCPTCNTGSVAEETDPIDWLICGGESGPGARPMHPDWARAARDACAAAGVAFFFKQWGTWATYIGPGAGRLNAEEHAHRMAGPGDKSKGGRLLDGVLHDAMPGRTQA